MLAPAVASAAGTTVSVRVEGLKRTLLAPTSVHTHAGWITKGGTPKGSCADTTATGALDVATHHRWGGNWDAGFSSLEVTSILGEAHPFTPAKNYWSVWVDGRFAQQGVCSLKLHKGEQLLFAAVSDTFNGYPVYLTAPSSAAAGQKFSVTVKFDQKGKLKPLAHARVSGHGVSATTNAKGIATITPAQAGAVVLQAAERGYIRSAPVTVRVS